MATPVAIGYSDEGTAEQARHTVQQLEAELVIRADQRRREDESGGPEVRCNAPGRVRCFSPSGCCIIKRR